MKKEKKKKIINILKPYLINTLIIISIFLLVMIISKTSPFGNNLLSKDNGISQYKPILYNFIMSLKTGSLLPYTFINALGESQLFNILYYTTSPINLIALPFNNGDIMYLIVILTKLAIASITTTFYAKQKGASNLTSLIATLTYVFSGWTLAYYYHIQWLDGFMMLPLLQYSIDKLINKKKYLPYIFTLAYIYGTNFLSAFAVVIYTIIYFIIANFFYKEKDLKDKFITLGIFLLSTLACILLLSCYLDALITVKSQMGLGFSNLEEQGYIVNQFDIIRSLFYGNYNLTLEFNGSTYPNLCINSIALISLFYIFLNKKISTKDKIFTFITIDLVLACIIFKKLDFIMNMFHNVVGLTYRYSYIFTFLTIIPLIKNLNTLDDKSNLKKIRYIIIPIIIILLLNIKYLDKTIILLNLIPLLLIFIITFFYKNNNKYNISIIILIIIQTFIGCLISIPNNIEKENIEYKFNKETTTYRLNRIDKNDFLNKNMYTNQSVTYSYTSMGYNEPKRFLNIIGCSTGYNVTSCDNNNLFASMLINVKNDNYYLEKIYTVNNTIKETYLLEDNIQIAQEELIKGMTGIENIHDKHILKGTKEDDKYLYETEYKFYLIDEKIDDSYITNYPLDYQSFNSKDEEVTIYTINDNKLKEIYEYLSKNQINYTKYTDSYIEGTINVDENQLIFTTIPYDKSWHVKIDDKEVETIKVLDSLLAIDCEPGEHKITLEYKNNFKKSTIISITTFIILISIPIIKHIKKRTK